MRRKEILVARKKEDIALQKEDGERTALRLWCAVCAVCDTWWCVTFITNGDWLPKISPCLLHRIKLDTYVWN